MNARRHKIVVIVGPTASGKSNLGVSLSKRIRGEIISADSRQVYKGLDIGSGKITKKEMRRVPHYGLDIANIKSIFTAESYKKYGERILTKIIQKKRIPVIVGGTGFYIDVLLGRKETAEVPPNPKLRSVLEKKSAEALFAMLKKMDHARAKQIDRHNPRRLVRAIEIARWRLNHSFPSPQQLSVNAKRYADSFDVLWLGIRLPPEELKKRIHKRLLRRMPGMAREIKKLRQGGVGWKRLNDFGLEYRWVSLYLCGRISKDEMLAKLETAIHHYAKRQMTWFRKNKEIHWISKLQDAERMVKKFLYNKTRLGYKRTGYLFPFIL